MSDAPSSSLPTPISAMPTYLDTLLSVLLSGLGAALVSRHVLSAPQLQDGVGALITLLGLAWAAINANPHRQSPIAFLMALLGHVTPAQQAQWNAAIQAASGAIEARIEATVDQALKARLGLLSGPAAALANEAIVAAGGQAAAKVETPHLKITP